MNEEPTILWNGVWYSFDEYLAAHEQRDELRKKIDEIVSKQRERIPENGN